MFNQREGEEAVQIYTQLREAGAAGWPGGPRFHGLFIDGMEFWSLWTSVPTPMEWEIERELRDRYVIPRDAGGYGIIVGGREEYYEFQQGNV